MTRRYRDIDQLIVVWDDGTETNFIKRSDGAWKADGLQPFGPRKLLSHVAGWVDDSYNDYGESGS